MNIIVLLLLLALQGLVIGALARLALPGRDPMSIWQTIGIGLVGSLAAGLITYFLAGESAAPSFLAALFVSIGIVYLIRRSRGGGLMHPDARRRPTGVR